MLHSLGKNKTLFLSFLFILVLSGCGGGGGGSSQQTTTKTGTLIDNVVSGVKYVNNGVEKFTDSNGQFTYESGVTEFFVGNIKLGEINSFPTDGNLFIQDIVGVNRTNVSDATVLKIAMLLQSLDSNPATDEIEISSSDFAKFNSTNDDISNINLNTLFTSLSLTLKTQAEVEKHLLRVLNHYKIIDDTQGPTLSSTNKSFNTVLGIPLTFETVTADDNIDKNSDVTQSGTVDFNTVGTYTITYTSTDKAGNTSSIVHTYEVTVLPTVTHNTISYNIVTSPITGKRWLDRNLGATAVCTKSRDDNSFTNDADYVTDQESCFGDYYQWGRLTDGHEKKNSTASSTRAKDVTSAGNNFIISSAIPFEWTENASEDSNNVDDDKTLRNIQWSKTDGNSICPVGFRVPSSAEMYSETVDYTGSEDETYGKVKVINRDTAFKNFLKFPSSGLREKNTGTLVQNGSVGYVWLSSSNIMGYNSSSELRGNDYNENGFTVRCIEDTNTNPTANAGDDKDSIDGTTLSFDGSASSDSDGSISSYEWKLGNTVLSTNASFSKSDLAVGTHTITLIVTDNDGAKDFDQIEVDVVATSLTHDSFTYNTIVSPITGKVWLDRNLGATAVCTKSRGLVENDFDGTTYADESSANTAYVTDQESCFGDYYQWGRLTDGHEKKTSTMIEGRVTDITSAGVNLIKGSSYPHDWVESTTLDSNNVDDNGSLRSAQWSKIDGTSVCPIGFRVPTSSELENETVSYAGVDNESTGSVKVTNIDTAFKNFLKFPASGRRYMLAGTFSSVGSMAYAWTSSPDGNYSDFMQVTRTNSFVDRNARANIVPVRCIKD